MWIFGSICQSHPHLFRLSICIIDPCWLNYSFFFLDKLLPAPLDSWETRRVFASKNPNPQFFYLVWKVFGNILEKNVINLPTWYVLLSICLSFKHILTPNLSNIDMPVRLQYIIGWTLPRWPKTLRLVQATTLTQSSVHVPGLYC